MSWSGRRRRPLPQQPDSSAAREIKPGQITAITGQSRDPERVNVYLDGAFAFGLHRDVAQAEGLTVGDDLDAARIRQLRAADDIARATNAALVFLGYRARSEREVRDRLKQKGYAPEAIDPTIERLVGWGYLNDADFARFWTENRAQHKPRGRRLLEQELRQKGVDRELVRETLDEAELDEEAAAFELAQTRLRRSSTVAAEVDVEGEKRRLAGYLARRGYTYDVIKPVLRRLFAGDEPED